MFKTLKRNFFPFIIAFSALSVSASAAFYSVSGLSKLFAGASFEVIIMAASLEIAKLVIASLLYQYWDTINKWLRTYLTIAAIVLVLITSMGIYGFLSAAYQETYAKLVVNQNQIEFLESKADFYQEDLDRYDAELVRISENISTLSNARSQTIQVRDTASSTGFRQTISTSELRLAQSRINVEEENRKAVQSKREVAADSLQTYKLQILDLQNDNDTVGELGPLQYLSGLTGTPMDKIINWLLLVIIFVFDPLAISLVVAANFAFDQARPKKKDIEIEELEDDPEPEDEDENYEQKEYFEDIIDRFETSQDILDKPRFSPQNTMSPEEELNAWQDVADKLNNKEEILKQELENTVDDGLEDEEWDEEHAFDQVLNHMVEDMDEEELYDSYVDRQSPEQADETEIETTDRTGTFPNQNNPTSVAAVVNSIVEKIPTPHLPDEARGVEPPKVEPTPKITKDSPASYDSLESIDEDELFNEAMRKKAEKEMKDFLSKKDGNSKT